MYLTLNYVGKCVHQFSHSTGFLCIIMELQNKQMVFHTACGWKEWGFFRILFLSLSDSFFTCSVSHSRCMPPLETPMCMWRALKQESIVCIHKYAILWWLPHEAVLKKIEKWKWMCLCFAKCFVKLTRNCCVVLKADVLFMQWKNIVIVSVYVYLLRNGKIFIKASYFPSKHTHTRFSTTHSSFNVSR